MLTEEKALIGAVNDNRVLLQSGLVQVVKNASDVVINSGNAAQVILDVALVFPAHQLFAAQIRFKKRLVLRSIGRIPGSAFIGGHPAH